MNRRSLRAHLAGHYEAQAMSAERLDALLTLVRDGAGVDAARPRAGRRWRRAPLAAAALLVLAVGVGVVLQRPGVGDAALTDQVCREIILNHNKDLALDIEADDFQQIVRKMDQVSFVPREPAVLAEKGLRLVGARYCAVQGCEALQIRLVDRQGRRYTLYQVRPDPNIEGVRAATLAIDNVTVRVWREQGLIMGLAGPTL